MKETKSARRICSDKSYYLIRIAVVVMVVFLFMPALNPSRICGLINKNISLFTAGVSYNTLTDGFGRAFKKEWINESTMRLLSYSSIAAIAGIAIVAAGACMSLGNIRMKKRGNILCILGTLVVFAALIGIYTAHGQAALTEKPDKIEPMFPGGIMGQLSRQKTKVFIMN